MKMKMGILGAGRIAVTMAQTIAQMPDVTAWSVGSRSLEKAQAFAKEHGFEKAYGSYEELVKDPQVDLIYVATPHAFHAEQIKLCLEHGKHVLAEKAFTLTADQAREVLALAEQKGLLLTEAIWTRYLPMRKKLDEVLASGVIGKPTSLWANLSYSLLHKERIVDRSLGGGALLDIGVYCLNFASMVFGDDIKEVKATAVLSDQGIDLADSITLIYGDGKMAVLHSNAQAESDREGLIYGDKGYIRVLNINNCEGILVYNENHQEIAKYETPKQISGYEYEVEACARAIEKGDLECPDMPHSETIRMMELMDQIREQIGVRYDV